MSKKFKDFVSEHASYTGVHNPSAAEGQAAGFADPNVIITPPEKPIELPSEDVTFELSTDQLDKLLKAASIYQLPDLSVVGENGAVKLLVRDKKHDTSNVYSVTVGETDKTF